MIRRTIRATLLSLACLGASLLLTGPAQAAKLRIGGTGIGLAAMQRVGDSLAAKDPTFDFEVLPSLGTSGGIKALAKGVIDIAITARALKGEEQALDVSEAACMTTALIFATSHTGDASLTAAQIPGLYADPSPRWPDGTAMKIILRSRAGSENPYLEKIIPGLEEPMRNAYGRPGIPVGATDQENAELATRTRGSLAVMTTLQLRAEGLDLKILPLDGILPSSTTLADKTYPMPLRVCLLLRTKPSADAAGFITHLKSAAGQSMTRSFEVVTEW